MLFEDFDKKIREAAEQHHPAYDEKAWQKMEKLLDEHLPQQKDDNRRIFLLLLLFLLIGGGVFMIISKPFGRNGSSNQLTATDRSTRQSNSSIKNNNSEKTAPVTAPAGSDGEEKVKSTQATVSAIPKPGSSQSISSPTRIAQNLSSANRRNTSTGRIQPGQTRSSGPENSSGSFNSVANKVYSPVTYDEELKKTSSGIRQLSTQSQISSVEINQIKNFLNSISPALKGPTPPQKKIGPGRNNGFSLLLSGGPEVSKAGTSKTGKTTVLYGAAIGFTRNRLTLRAGVYASKKIYWANASEYKLSFTPPPAYQFEGANANCDVIEIPIKLSYNFGYGKRDNWFAGAGISSYLMKKEDYVYNYKTASGTSYYDYSAANENKHYFSILNLSGGYMRKISRSVSISAEPYVEIPLKGIGVGKVHLGSGGVLFTVGVNPFRK